MYGSESNIDFPVLGEIQNLNHLVEPWSTGHGEFANIRPWSDPGSGEPHTYKDLSVVTPPCYDTNLTNVQVLAATNPLDVSVTPNRFKVNFNDIPDTETTWRAATIRIYSCNNITLNVIENAAALVPFTVITSMPLVTPPGPHLFVDARIWFQYTAPAPSSPLGPHNIAPVNVTIHCTETNQDFLFELTGNTISQQTVAIQLVLDQTGSMDLPAGSSGSTRLEVLKSAAHVFAKFLPAGNGIGIIRFDDVAYAPADPTYGGMVMTTIVSNDFSDPTRVTASGVIDAHGAHGMTSIGAGLLMGQALLNAVPLGTYDNKALIILTDGLENKDPRIQDVLVDSKTFALGLGNELQVDTSKLFAIAGGSRGYLLLTGTLTEDTDDFFRLGKFFLQIAANVTNTSIVKDPSGYISPGISVKIPFVLSEADINCQVNLLTDFDVVKLAIETPDGQLIDAANAATFGVEFDSDNNMQQSRFGLPIAFTGNRIQAGTWYVVLEIDTGRYNTILIPTQTRTTNFKDPALSRLRTKGARYCVSIHSFSNLKMNATINQSGFTPGSEMHLKAILTEYNLPVEHRVRVKAKLEYPDGSTSFIPLNETEPGVFTTSMVAVIAGIYRFKIIAEGGTYYGAAFSREQLLNGAVYHNTSNTTPSNSGSDGVLQSLIAKCCARTSIFMVIIILLLLLLLFLLIKR